MTKRTTDEILNEILENVSREMQALNSRSTENLGYGLANWPEGSSKRLYHRKQDSQEEVERKILELLEKANKSTSGVVEWK